MARRKLLGRPWERGEDTPRASRAAAAPGGGKLPVAKGGPWQIRAERRGNACGVASSVRPERIYRPPR
eukprot:1960266-Pyramimonas_sp.AAC.1